MSDLLFPYIQPHIRGRLDLDHGHTMYWEESGNAQGIPVLLLHGGPGAGISPGDRRYFDPSRFRIIAFDQRGCGKSTPSGETRANTTLDLLADVERLRAARAVDRWLLFGGSWGSTLALTYALAYPQRCVGLLLRGVFLGERHEISWFLYGLQPLRPQAWRRFASAIPECERADLLGAYCRRLNDPDEAVRMRAARAWARYEAEASTLLPNKKLSRELAPIALALARLEAHYYAHDCFLAPRYIREHANALAGVPCTIVHGQYDLLTVVQTARDLHEALPGSRLRVVPGAGHSAAEPNISRELLRACNAME